MKCRTRRKSRADGSPCKVFPCWATIAGQIIGGLILLSLNISHLLLGRYITTSQRDRNPAKDYSSATWYSRQYRWQRKIFVIWDNKLQIYLKFTGIFFSDGEMAKMQQPINEKTKENESAENVDALQDKKGQVLHLI